jgi:hypothetical protein
MIQNKTFDKHMKKPESNQLIVKKVREIALSATIIHVSIFTNLFHQRFPKQIYLESTLELLQQVYIEMKIEPGCFCLIPGDLSLYTLKCVCCCQSITAPRSIGGSLYHALGNKDTKR